MLDRQRTALLVVDEQEAFRAAIADFDRVISATRTMVRAARILEVPVIVTEQYPRGLGHTVEEIAADLEGAVPLEKISFSATGAEGFDLGSRDQVMLCGVETALFKLLGAAGSPEFKGVQSLVK
jgi:nicotinamidase-related amidase